MTSLVPSVFLPRNHPIKRLRRMQLDLQARGITADEPQERLLRELAQLGSPKSNTPTIRGCYIYGPPGRGKSLLLDTFAAVLDSASSARYHFHEFFHEVQQAGASDEDSSAMGSVFMRGLTSKLQGIRTLCFDEFHCVEPGDAMFMARLVSYCQEHDITLIATSNYAPEQLLDDPYFHHLIEPTIAKIRADFTVFPLDNQLDYRRTEISAAARSGFRAGKLLIDVTPPIPKVSASSLRVGYDNLAPVYIDGEHLQISYQLLCQTRRNTRDYLELARQFNRWSIVGIPRSDNLPMDEERRFANLLDVLYDRDVQVDLYCRDELSTLGHQIPLTEAERLSSRLAHLVKPTFDRG